MMVLEFENGERIAVSSSSQIEELLDRLGEADKTFIILTAPNGHYFQAATSKQGHVMEKQLGDLSEHYRATLHGRNDGFSLRDVKQAARNFFDGKIDGAGLRWEEFDFGQDVDVINPDDLEHFILVYGDTRAARFLWLIRRVEKFFFPILSVGFVLFIVIKIAQGFLASP